MLNALETRLIRTRIFPKSSFSGEIVTVYSCGDFIETRKHFIEHEQENQFIAGLAGLGAIQGDLFGVTSFEGINGLNIFLVIVAAFLLAMFISRFVRIMVVSKNPASEKPAENKNAYIKQPEFSSSDKKLQELKNMITQGKGSK